MPAHRTWGAPASPDRAGCPSVVRIEAVRPVPGTIGHGRARDHDRPRAEVGEFAGPAGERDYADERPEIEDHMPVRSVVAGPVDDEVAVQIAGSRIAGRRGIDDFRADL